MLPFVNLSSDPEQEFFADGIADDVITALSRYRSLFVIARNSSFTYRGRTIDAKQVGRELGVRYLLEGSLRKSDRRIRVNAQLVEAETGNHLWAERYDRDLADIFAVQDEITEAVTIAIAPAIGDAERQRAVRKPPASLDAWGAYQRGLWHFGKANAADYRLAEEYFQRAIDLDPNFSRGYTWLALVTGYLGVGVFPIGSLTAGLDASETLIRRALALDGADAEARSLLAEALAARGEYQGALVEATRAVAMTPNLAGAHGALGAVLTFCGRPKEGLISLQTCLRLDALSPLAAVRMNLVAVAQYFSGDYQEAAEAAGHTIRAYPDMPHSYRWLAAALGQLDRMGEAKEALGKAIAVAPATFDMYVRIGCRGYGRKITPICSKGCARPGCRRNSHDAGAIACGNPRADWTIADVERLGREVSVQRFRGTSRPAPGRR